jgi:hypothetical protein
VRFPTLLEQAAIALANEVEQCLRLGVPMTSNCVNALDTFRKTQMNVGTDLDKMYKQEQQNNILKINKLKLVKGEKSE